MILVVITCSHQTHQKYSFLLDQRIEFQMMRPIKPIEIYKWLVNWCNSNPLESSEYQINVYNYTLYSKRALNKCLSFIYKNIMFVMQFGDLLSSIRITRKQKTYKDHWISQELHDYTLFHDYEHNRIQLYSDNRILHHKDLLEWFDKVPKLFDKNGILRMEVFKYDNSIINQRKT